LRRGYAVVRGDGALVTTRDAAAAAKVLEIEFADGVLGVGDTATAPRKAPKPKEPPKGQGSLF
jgi:exodeoxyribonuclease VII large subunit